MARAPRQRDDKLTERRAERADVAEQPPIGVTCAILDGLFQMACAAAPSRRRPSMAA